MKKIFFGLLFVVGCKVNIPTSLESDAGSNNKEQILTNEQSCYVEPVQDLCKELEIVTCTKVATCTDATYDECRADFDKDDKCKNYDIRAISACKEDFANTSCEGEFPGFCLLLK